MDDLTRKLLALTTSPNKYEAETALLKLRERLYPETNMKPPEEMSPEKKYTIQRPIETRTELSFTVSRDPWLAELSELIATKHGCATYQIRRKKGSARTVVLYGYSQNVEIARYALEAAYAQLKKNLMKYENSQTDISRDYAYGYIKGLYKLYTRQDRDKQEGQQMVISVPEDVKKR